ncbi:hypothetical protein TYRP_001284 [Tyrophagus putrescentiae]|nr:hypothetical protein TYRP_001284 [Tyrophagus putrescentiae]
MGLADDLLKDLQGDLLLRRKGTLKVHEQLVYRVARSVSLIAVVVQTFVDINFLGFLRVNQIALKVESGGKLYRAFGVLHDQPYINGIHQAIWEIFDQ